MAFSEKDMAPKGMVYVCPECKRSFNFLPRGNLYCTNTVCSGAKLELVKDRPKTKAGSQLPPRGSRTRRYWQ